MSEFSVVSAGHSAPGQYLGFSLQPVRMFFHLLNAPDGASVSLEHLDDVAAHYPDGSVSVEQAKSALSHNPLSDWAVDLWKTIANWLTASSSGVLEMERTQFRLYVTPIRTGTLSDTLHSAKTADEVLVLTKNIRKKLATKKSDPKCLEHL